MILAVKKLPPTCICFLLTIFRILPSMRFTYFSILLRSCFNFDRRILSLGVREAPFPSEYLLVDPGTRQTNRNNSDSITNINLLCKDSEIKCTEAINSNWGKNYPSDPSFRQRKCSSYVFKTFFKTIVFGILTSRSILMNNMHIFEHVVGIIPARMNSKRLKNKKFS